MILLGTLWDCKSVNCVHIDDPYSNDNAKNKRRQTTIYKTEHSKLIPEQQCPNHKPGVIPVATYEHYHFFHLSK